MIWRQLVFDKNAKQCTLTCLSQKPTLQTPSYSLRWNTSPHGTTSVEGNYQSLGQNFDLDDFMKNAKSKYTHNIKDNMWTKSKITEDNKKDLEIAALNSKINFLEALLVKTTRGNSTLKNNSDFNKKITARTCWKLVRPTQGKQWTQRVNGNKFHWYKYHNSSNYHKGLKLQEQNNQTRSLRLKSILQQLIISTTIFVSIRWPSGRLLWC